MIKLCIEGYSVTCKVEEHIKWHVGEARLTKPKDSLCGSLQIKRIQLLTIFYARAVNVV